MSTPPGEVLARELADREWTQAVFAEILGRPMQFVSEVITGKKEITRQSAGQIGAALGTSPEYWLQLQHDYRLGLQLRDEECQERLWGIRLRAAAHEGGMTA